MPGRRTFRAGVKWFFWPALIILALNIQNLATAFGWHDLLVRSWPAVASAVTWLELPAAVLVGAGLALWIDANLRREEAFKALDDLYAEGVVSRNELIPPISDYDDQTERAQLCPLLTQADVSGRPCFSHDDRQGSSCRSQQE